MEQVKKNDHYIVDIIDLTYEGMGVAKLENYPIFVANALPSEKVEIKILKVSKKFAFAKVEQWLKKSKDRVADTCVTWTQTGIAPLQHMTYHAQLAFKTKQVKECLHKQKLDDITVHDTVSSPQEFHYRNKAQVPVQKVNGALTTGFYRKNSHDFIPLTHFGIQNQKIDEALAKICAILDQYQVSAYNEKTHTGVLRHIIIRRGYYSHEMMVTLVTRKKQLFKGKEIAQAIHQALPEVVSVMQNINDQKTNVIMGKTFHCLFGKDYIVDTMCGHQFHIASPSFYQVNTPQAEAMYQKAIDLAQVTKNDIAIDAYCGIGTITLAVAPHVKEIYGVEVVEEAIDNARENAEINHIDQAYFEAGKAEHVIKRWQRENIQPDVVFVDPPRKGLEQSFMETMVELAPKKIAYISCNPATFARDAYYLKEHGYECHDVYPYDMFPQTTHVEVVALFERG